MPLAAAASLVLVALAGPPVSGGTLAAAGVPIAKTGSSAVSGDEDLGDGSDGERGRVKLRLEGPIPPAIATLAESDLRTAFGRRGVELTRSEGATAAAPAAAPGTGVAAATAHVAAGDMVLTVVAASERLDQVVVTLERAGASTLIRRLNLSSVPADGRVLSLVVAADEMLVASIDERLARRRAAGADSDAEPTEAPAPVAERAPEAASANTRTPAKPEPVPPAPLVAVATTAGATAAHGPRGAGVAAALAFDHFTGGETQLGFDLTWTQRVRSRAYGLLSVQGRRGLSATDASGIGTVDTSLLGGRLAAGLRLIDDGGPLRLAIDVGLRAGRLALHGNALDGAVKGNDFGIFLLCADAMLTLDIRLGRSPVSARLGAGGGPVLMGHIAAAMPAGQMPERPVTGVSGVAFESQGGIVLNF